MSYSNSYNYGKPKGKAIKVITLIAVILVICALCGLIPNFFNSKDGDYERIYVNWTVGGIKSDGSFDSDVKDSMVSDLIKIDGGIKLVLDYESCASYDVYVYDEYKSHIELDGTYSNVSLTFDVDTLTTGAFYIRIVLHPVDKNNIINVFEKIKYANYLEIYRASLDEDGSSSD